MAPRVFQHVRVGNSWIEGAAGNFADLGVP